MDSLKKRIKRHEGFNNYCYKDHLGYYTIGYGRCILEGKGPGISEDEGDYLLNNDLCRLQSHLSNFLWFESLDDVRQGVIVELAYNCGVSGLFTFVKMIEALKEKDYTKARLELIDSKWRRQVQLERSHDMSFRLQFGQYQDE